MTHPSAPGGRGRPLHRARPRLEVPAPPASDDGPLPAATFVLGDHVQHARFGVGLVVDVRVRDAREILEVVFADQVRSVDARHPLLARAVSPAQVAHESNDACTWEWETDSEAVAQAALAGAYSPQEKVALRLEAETLGLVRGFERLLALDAMHDVARYSHQIDACRRVLRDMQGRALLADEVGLGKTIEAGLIVKECVLRGLIRSVLVLAPVSLQIQWQEELSAKFDLPFALHGRREGWESEPLLIASLETAKTRRNIEQVLARNFDLVIVDEAHRLKNHRTVGWSFLNHVRAPYLLLLTATPVQNDLRELYNLITLIRPGTLGTYAGFRRTYTMRGDKRIPRNADSLGRLLSTVMIRNTRATTGIALLQRTVETIRFPLAAGERQLYDAISRLVRRIMTGETAARQRAWYFTLLTLQKEVGSSAAAAAQTLAAMSRSPRYADTAKELAALALLAAGITTSRKRDALLKLCATLPESVIVFTQFRATQRELVNALREVGRTVEIFHGALNATEKDAAIRRFRAGHHVVLVSTEAGGEGRNLQFCRTVINYDLPWNPMRLEQRIGRVYRLGQTKPVRIYNFAAAGTLEEHVLDLLQKKIRMFELVIGEMEMVLGAMKTARSFDDMVFRIWATARDDKDLVARFDELGEEVLFARRQYESMKDIDQSILDAVQPAAHPRAELGGAAE